MKKKKLLLVIPLMIVMMMMYMMYFFANMAYGYPYGKTTLTKEDIPTFSQTEIDFTHQFDDKNDLHVLGSAVIDVDNDGKLEVFIGGGHGQQDALYRYDGTRFLAAENNFGMQKNTDAATYGVAVFDVDQDGYDDMYIARDDGVYFYKNTSGTFAGEKLDISLAENSAPLSLALGDINSDGIADMYISAYLQRSAIEGLNIFHKEGYGGQSQLLLGLGENQFQDITQSTGIYEVHNTFQASFVDMDNDNFQDLIVVQDTGVVKTYKNNGDLTFTDMPNPTSGVYAYPMGLAIGDYNNDGLQDFAFSNIGDMGPMTFMVRGDLEKNEILNDRLMLLKNNGNFQFQDVADELKIKDYEFSWGIVFEDFNNDTKEDIVMAQNFISLPPYKMFKAPARLLMQGQNHFESVEKESGTANRSFGVNPLVADFDNNGTKDIVFVNLNGKALAYINNTKTDFIGFSLANTSKYFGAKIKLKTNLGSYEKLKTQSEGLASELDTRIVFPLQADEEIESVILKLLDGAEQSLDMTTKNIYHSVN